MKQRDFVMGSLHRAAPPIHHDSDALRLQDALLGNSRPIDWDGIGIVVGTALAALIVWVMA